MQTTMRSSRYYQGGGSHPYEHSLRLKQAASSYIQSTLTPERSLTVTNFQINPRTTFEMDRPQSHGSPRLVVINTSFRTAYQDRNTPRKRVPTFPELASDPATKRKSNISRQTNSSLNSTMSRRRSGNSNFRSSVANRNSGGLLGRDRELSARERELSAKDHRELSARERELSARDHRELSARERDLSARSREISGNSDRRAASRGYLTARQSNTFAAYAKYNDIVNSTKARERASESPITSNINDLSALVPQKLSMSPDVLSNEKHVWISDWVASTSAAMRLDEHVTEESRVPKPLSVIHEQ